jgi:hypothetical protein
VPVTIYTSERQATTEALGAHSFANAGVIDVVAIRTRVNAADLLRALRMSDTAFAASAYLPAWQVRVQRTLDLTGGFARSRGLD